MDQNKKEKATKLIGILALESASRLSELFRRGEIMTTCPSEPISNTFLKACLTLQLDEVFRQVYQRGFYIHAMAANYWSLYVGFTFGLADLFSFVTAPWQGGLLRNVGFFQLYVYQ